MEDVVPQSNRFFSICQKHICCVIFHWHSIINNPIHFKILHKIWLLFVYILVKPPWLSIPCFGKYFLCSSLFNCLYLFIHTLFLPAFFIIICTKTSITKTCQKVFVCTYGVFYFTSHLFLLIINIRLDF